ncbi:MAG: redox-sensing transcriptional repressor Rex [Planctomycetales bacterium]|nr:redox-sensing transcriptional repressor Rex [Planctomycetales bacterium]NIP69751.1 redox-sensing transcriptional repressor Rex [Planctomycetales bacterium]
MSASKPRQAEQPPVPKAVVNRLSLYLRELQHLLTQRRETISSGELGSRLGFSDAQVRKDLAYFGQFGYPGIGYRCGELVPAIRKILGTQCEWPVALVGIGNLGRALLGYKGFARQGFHIVAALDSDPAKIGTLVEGIQVADIADLVTVIQQRRVRLGMIAVPATAAQQVADRMVEAGVEGIVNFAPVTISIPPDVSLIGVDLAIELEQIAFAVVNRAESR